VHDLAVIIVSTDQADWLPACLPTVLARSGSISLDLVVVDNGSTRATRDLVERDFPQARVLVVPNRGFAHANNEAMKTVDARYVLFLNPDTELLEGTLAELLAELDARPEIGLAGVRQLGADGRVYPTMRRFPNIARTLGDALGLERLAARPASLGERELAGDRYDREFESDWTIGSFMLVRRDALAAVGGGFDERFFVYSEEVDLCLRIKRAGWTIVHLPTLTILHHGSSARTLDARMAQQNAYAQLQYADKHFDSLHRIGFRAALLLRYGLRSLPPFGDPQRRTAARAAASLVLGHADPPFGRGAR
jgi:GT2 family glycosyltransferase